jgi:hypothetical protein
MDDSLTNGFQKNLYLCKIIVENHTKSNVKIIQNRMRKN